MSLDIEDLRAIGDRFAELLALKPNWDSYDAKAIDPATVARARDFVARLKNEPKPSIVPTSNGGVQLEWHRGSQSIELEFQPHDDDCLYWEGESLDTEILAAVVSRILDKETP